MSLAISLVDSVDEDEVVSLHSANDWSSAKKPAQLMAARRNSHSLATARDNGVLIGLGNAVSVGHLVVYVSHMWVHPLHQGNGVGRLMMESLPGRYKDFHQMMLMSDGLVVEFYRRLGLECAGKAEAMWIYGGNEH